jgi:hypothetical protein
MNRPVRRYVEKLEAMDFSAGTYHARKLPRARYNRTDFMEYLNIMQSVDDPLSEIDEDFDSL